MEQLKRKQQSKYKITFTFIVKRNSLCSFCRSVFFFFYLFIYKSLFDLLLIFFDINPIRVYCFLLWPANKRSWNQWIIVWFRSVEKIISLDVVFCFLLSFSFNVMIENLFVSYFEIVRYINRFLKIFMLNLCV